MCVKIQSLMSLKQEMLAVARGEMDAPPDAAARSFESADVLLELLSPANRQLLILIKEHLPQSVSALALLAGRTEAEVGQALNQLAAGGLVRLRTGTQARAVAEVLVSRIVFDISMPDPAELASST